MFQSVCVKKIQLVKMTDMYWIAIWKLYFKLMNNMLPSYFDIMKPVLPVKCSLYELRKPTCHLPQINHEYAEKWVKYQLISINFKCIWHYNTIKHINTIKHTHSFHGFKLNIMFLAPMLLILINLISKCNKHFIHIYMYIFSEFIECIIGIHILL